MRVICDSMINHKVIEISLFDEYEELKVVGVVERVDQYLKQISIETIYKVDRLFFNSFLISSKSISKSSYISLSK
jgi:phage tail sheath gpL-like